MQIHLIERLRTDLATDIFIFQTEARSGNEHLTNEDLAGFVDHSLEPEEMEMTIAHLANCKECRTVVAEVEMSRVAVSDPELAPPSVPSSSKDHPSGK